MKPMMAEKNNPRKTVNPNAALTKLALGEKFDPNDYFIAIMGETGSGKSTFISHLFGDRDGGPRIGETSESCTHDIEVFSVEWRGRTLHLIDTMGFGDTYLDESKILQRLAYWLSESYKQQIKLSGIIHLHPISHKRMTGPNRANMNLFRELCGKDSLASVVLATTMWPEEDNPKQEKEYAARQREFESKPQFWGTMVSHGSTVLRHDNNKESAVKLVEHILSRSKRVVLQIQQELEDGKDLDKTSAGQELNREFNKRLENAIEEAKQGIALGDQTAVNKALEDQAMLEKKIEELRVNKETLIKQYETERQEVAQRLEAERKRHEEQILKLRENLSAKDEDASSIRAEKKELESQLRREIILRDSMPAVKPSTFRKAFKESAGSELGKKVVTGVAVGVGTVGAAATAVGTLCNVM